MSTEQNADERLEAVQETVDRVRDRLPDNPGTTVHEPDGQPLFPADEDEDVFPDDE